MQRLAERSTALAALLIAIALGVIAYQSVRRNDAPQTGTPYQAVALMNGQLFYGRLEAAGDGYFALRDVFYIQARQNPDTRAVANVLVKRGGEAHQPDRMLLNRQQVLLIEPVKVDSQVAQLIAQQQATQPASR